MKKERESKDGAGGDATCGARRLTRRICGFNLFGVSAKTLLMARRKRRAKPVAKARRNGRVPEAIREVEAGALSGPFTTVEGVMAHLESCRKKYS